MKKFLRFGQMGKKNAVVIAARGLQHALHKVLRAIEPDCLPRAELEALRHGCAGQQMTLGCKRLIRVL